ncbi:MAG: DNA translocase FtsK [Thermoflavifilum sp.]|nr:DNA translocase FtsK [Thermoflavifilum sp.]
MARNRLKSEQSVQPSAAEKSKAAEQKALRNSAKNGTLKRQATTSTNKSTSTHKNHKLLAIFSWLIAISLFIAFTSYLFTWKEDQDKIFSLSYHILFNNDIEVNNLLGRLGAYVSHYFFYEGIGIAAYFLCYLFFIIGVNLLVGRRVFRILSQLFFIVFGILYISTTAGFLMHILNYSGFPFAGALGDLMSNYLIRFIGALGTAVVLILTALAYLIWKFNFDIPVPNTLPAAEALHTEQTEEPATVSSGLSPSQPSSSATSSTINEWLGKQMQLIEKDEIAPQSTEKPISPIPSTEKKTPKQSATDVELEIKKPVQEEKTVDEPVASSAKELYEPTLDLKDYQYPSLDLLDDHGTETIVHDNEELRKNKEQIIHTLKNYDIEIRKISATVGPTVTLYEIVPAAGVRISRIKNLEDDIALSLSALGIRIIAPIPGKGTIGIEVPNEKKAIVSIRTLLSSEKFQHTHMQLPIALGKKIDNENFIVDLTTMPHLLMAGATGQGKSVGINAILVSLLYKKHPSQLKFVLIDPKKVELSLYRTIEKHFLAKLPGEEEAIITDTKKAIHTLNALCIEMDIRYDLLKEAGARNIKEYNEKFIHRKLNPEKGHRFLPFIVLVIDEFADLIMTAGKEIEMPIARLAQLARAVGIHLIIATQRPSVNIITGIIKANFSVRIAFKVSSKVDSRTILDTGGAEQLVGKGDMLIAYYGDIVRLQCAFVDTPEVERVVQFIGQQRGYTEAYLLPEYEDEKEMQTPGLNQADRDPLFEEAARIIVATQQGSTSLLQRRMKLGYNRAGRLMDQLEAAGIVGPSMGSKTREVLIKTEAELEQFLRSIS